MPDPLDKRNLLRWFTNLHDLQNDCSINTSVKSLDLLIFANTTITSVLPSDNEQQQFIIKVQAEPGFDLSIADLTTFSTFEALLDNFSPLPTLVAAFLRTLAAGSFPNGSLVDFLKAQVSGAFPGGSSGPSWTKALSQLASAIPAVCFSAKLQAAVGKTVDDPTKTVSDVVNQIATLG
jgi:hypothetical protein